MTLTQASDRAARPSVANKPLIVTVTPSSLDAYGRCPLQYHEVFGKQNLGANRAIQRGTYIHRLADHYVKARIAGDALSIDATLARVSPPVSFQDGGDEERAILDAGREALIGYVAWLDAQEFASLLASERYIRTPPRPIRDVPGAQIVFSGRADLMARSATGSLEVTDLKMTTVAAYDELLAAPSSWVYRHLAAFAHDIEDIEIVQVAPTSGQSTRVRLGPAQIAAGVALARAFAASALSDRYPPQIGAYCGYCEFVDRCPGHRGRPGMAMTPF